MENAIKGGPMERRCLLRPGWGVLQYAPTKTMPFLVVSPMSRPLRLTFLLPSVRQHGYAGEKPREKSTR